jgi:hypothetical protein
VNLFGGTGSSHDLTVGRGEEWVTMVLGSLGVHLA